MGWPSLTGCPNVLAESSWPSELRPSELDRIRVAWPNEPLNQNHPGRVRLNWPNHTGRVNLAESEWRGPVNLAESEWHGRVNLAESEWALTGSLWPSPTEMAE